MLNRRTLISASAGAALLSIARTATAQTYPARPITLVVPFPPGGTADIIGRVLAKQLAQELNQPVVVDNRSGAGGSLGTKFVAEAAADGYTLLLGTSSTHGTNPAAYQKLPYDATRDFTPISLLNTVPGMLSVNKNFPANSMAELVALVKKNPGRYTYASSGLGGLGNLAMELFKSMSGTHIVHIPYRGAGPAMADVIGGQVDMIWEPIPAQLGFVQSGKLRPMAVAVDQRSPELPNVPTFKESGFPQYEATAWNGLLAPRNLPPATLQVLVDATLKALQQTDVKTRLKELGAVVVASRPQAFQQLIERDVAKWKRVTREAKITLD